MPFDADVNLALAESLDGAASWYEIYARLIDRAPEGEEERFRPLVFAFGYLLLGWSDTEARARHGGPFGPMIEMGGGRMPPPLTQIASEDIALWEEAFEAFDVARARSRLGDLLWELKVGERPDLKARAACAALVQLGTDPSWEPIEGIDAFTRALELARSLSDAALIADVAEAMIAAIEVELDSAEDRPGIPFTIVAPLVELPVTLRPEGLEDVIARMQRKYGDDPHHAETAIQLLVRLRPGEAIELRAQQVTLWREAAAKAHGITRLAWLQGALDLARTHGLTNAAEELRVELGQSSAEELDLQHVSAEVEVSGDEIEAFVATFVVGDDWRTSLVRFGRHGPPGGEPESVETAVRKQMADHPFQFLVTRIVLDPDTGATIFKALDDATQLKAATAQHRQFATRIWAPFAVWILERLVAAQGRPPHHELAGFFDSAFIDEMTADRIARAMELWWDGRSDESAHLLAPRLEAVLRELARRVGLPIIREPQGEKPGGVRSLGDLLNALEGRLPTAGWHAHLKNLLSDPLGLNLRNVIAHGLRAEVGREDAALLIHAACFLRLLGLAGAPPP